MRQYKLEFDPTTYGSEVARILALDGNGQRLMPLAMGRCSSEAVRDQLAAASPNQLFAGARSPEAAFSGLYLYFSCLDESHNVSQAIHSKEGAYWHGIMHRQEPDPGNAAYWFRQVGTHPIFPVLRDAASSILAKQPDAAISLPQKWNPFQFIEICERARPVPGSPLKRVALEIQRAEWQLLFDYCARKIGPRENVP